MNYVESSLGSTTEQLLITAFRLLGNGAEAITLRETARLDCETAELKSKSALATAKNEAKVAKVNVDTAEYVAKADKVREGMKWKWPGIFK